MSNIHQPASALLLVAAILLCPCCCAAAEPAVDRVAAEVNEQAGELTLTVDGQIAFVYRFGSSVDLPHFDPFNSATGRAMTVKITTPYPHHRSFWVADERVRLEGQAEAAGFYNCYYTGVKDKDESEWLVAPYTTRVAHVEFSDFKTSGDAVEFSEKLTWVHGDVPYLDELRHYRVRALGSGEYFLDFSFQLQASYGNVTIQRDVSHYAIPYIRMNDTFNVEKGGGQIVNSEGGINQEGTHDQPATWVDYSAPLGTKDGAEGIACFIHPSKNPPHLWLTRDYGTWGPRGPKGFHNATFTIARGEGYDQRVGVLVHNGSAANGDVAERYKAYCSGDL